MCVGARSNEAPRAAYPPALSHTASLGGARPSARGSSAAARPSVRPANAVTGMTHVNGKDGNWLYATCGDNTLWKLNLTNDSREWTKIGAAAAVISLASHNGWLYCLDKQQGMWQMDLYGPAPQWLPCEAYRQGKLTAISTFDGIIYGATKDHKLVKRQIQGTGWSDANAAKQVIGLACFKHRIYAACSNNLIWSFDLTQLANPTATWADCGRTNFVARTGFCSFNDMLFSVDAEAIWCRSLEKEGQWTKFADVPLIPQGGVKRAAPEPVVKFEGDVRALKQWRQDLVTKCEEAKAAYQAALGEVETWRGELQAQADGKAPAVGQARPETVG